MNCYLHPDREGIVTCGNCGVAMCSECESNVFYRLDNGKGQPLCNRCSMQSAEDNIRTSKKFLIKRAIKLVLSACFIIPGLIALVSEGGEDGVLVAAILWAISSVISNLGQSKGQDSVSDAIFKYDHPIISFIISVVINAVLAPFAWIANLIGFLRTFFSFKKEQKNLSSMHYIVNNS